MFEMYNGMTGKAGMSLCIAGSRKILINEQLYEVGRGFLCFLTPIVSVLEISRDEDYQEVAILDDTSVFYPAVRGIFDMIVKCRLRDAPCLQLSEENVMMFVGRQETITAKKEYAQSLLDLGEKKLVTRIVQLLEQQTMLEFFHLYYHGHPASPTVVCKGETILLHFLYSLHTNKNHGRSVAFYANEAGFSPNHFTRIIRKQSGKTPSELIALVMVAKAKVLLRRQDLNIKDVAAKLNFPEQYTFRKFFKLHVGMSPKEYKQQVQKTKS